MKSGYRLKGDSIEYRFSYKGKRCSVTAPTQAECREKAEAKKRLIDANVKIDAKVITFRQYYDEWLAHRTDIEESTRYDYGVTFQPILDFFGQMRMQDIDRRDVTRFMKEMSTRYAPSTANKKLGLISTVFKSAKLDKVIISNPAEGVKRLRDKPKVGETERKVDSIRALTLAEQEIFFRHARDKWYYELLALMMSTGLRVSECGALDWKDIDYTNQVIHVTKTVKKVGDNDWQVGTTKSAAGIRDIPLTDNIRKILSSQKAKIADHYGIAYVKPNCQVFRSLQTDSRIVSCMGVGAIKAILTEIDNDENEPIKIEHFSNHAFRDTFATRFIEQGGDMDTLRDILGHSDITITMNKYAKVLPDRMKEQINKIQISI